MTYHFIFSLNRSIVILCLHFAMNCNCMIFLVNLVDKVFVIATCFVPDVCFTWKNRNIQNIISFEFTSSLISSHFGWRKCSRLCFCQNGKSRLHLICFICVSIFRFFKKSPDIFNNISKMCHK